MAKRYSHKTTRTQGMTREQEVEAGIADLRQEEPGAGTVTPLLDVAGLGLAGVIGKFSAKMTNKLARAGMAAKPSPLFGPARQTGHVGTGPAEKTKIFGTLPKDRLVVAMKTKQGVFVGQPGDNHGTMINKMQGLMGHNKVGIVKEGDGFIGPDGKFLTRKEANEWVKKGDKSFDDPLGLESISYEDYLRGYAKDVGISDKELSGLSQMYKELKALKGPPKKE